ncbi:hypothetical protein KIPB_006899 [Kipferlia bialata]|uniref:Uncharacterized protein n=1 Tax=Kipferlia bialata TaxID=797122 RepID=A0A9K3GK42_9EUKA|nr:hypothetical protein KIPB_006899 [Kipferlia bialata]|eukprot:g6899.t1
MGDTPESGDSDKERDQERAAEEERERDFVLLLRYVLSITPSTRSLPLPADLRTIDIPRLVQALREQKSVPALPIRLKSMQASLKNPQRMVDGAPPAVLAASPPPPRVSAPSASLSKTGIAPHHGISAIGSMSSMGAMSQSMPGERERDRPGLDTTAHKRHSSRRKSSSLTQLLPNLSSASSLFDLLSSPAEIKLVGLETVLLACGVVSAPDALGARGMTGREPFVSGVANSDLSLLIGALRRSLGMSVGKAKSLTRFLGACTADMTPTPTHTQGGVGGGGGPMVSTLSSRLVVLVRCVTEMGTDLGCCSDTLRTPPRYATHAMSSGHSGKVEYTAPGWVGLLDAVGSEGAGPHTPGTGSPVDGEAEAEAEAEREGEGERDTSVPPVKYGVSSVFSDTRDFILGVVRNCSLVVTGVLELAHAVIEDPSTPVATTRCIENLADLVKQKFAYLLAEIFITERSPRGVFSVVLGDDSRPMLVDSTSPDSDAELRAGVLGVVCKVTCELLSVLLYVQAAGQYPSSAPVLSALCPVGSASVSCVPMPPGLCASLVDAGKCCTG